MMSDETRETIDHLRAIIRKIGVSLKALRNRLDEIEKVKTGPRGEIDLDEWNRADHVQERVKARTRRRNRVQTKLNDFLRPYKARRVIPVLREKGIPVRTFLERVREALAIESPYPRHLIAEIDEALALDDEGQALGKLLDLFLFGEIRGAVEKILGVKVSNGNGA